MYRELFVPSVNIREHHMAAGFLNYFINGFIRFTTLIYFSYGTVQELLVVHIIGGTLSSFKGFIT